MKTLFYILILASAFTAHSQHNDGIRFFNGTVDDALIAAKEQGKQVYIDCQTSWCGPCKKMSKEIFTNKEVAEYYNEHFISISMDMEKEGTGYAKEFNVRYYPTHVYLNPSGVVLHNVIGFQYKDQFYL